VCAVACTAAHAVRDGPGGLPDGSLMYRFGGWFEAGPASCPMARSQHFGGGFDSRWARRLARWLARGTLADGSRRARRLARRLTRGASADASVETGPVSCPAAHTTTASRVRLGKVYAHTPDPPGCGPEPEATRPGRSDNRIRPMVSRSTPFPQLIAGFKSRPHVSPWLRPRELYPQQGSYPC